MAWAKRVDSSHKEVMAGLREVGWRVRDVSRLPNFVDLVACKGGQVRLIEVKTEKGKLRPSQQELLDDGFPVVIVRSREEAISLK